MQTSSIENNSGEKYNSSALEEANNIPLRWLILTLLEAKKWIIASGLFFIILSTIAFYVLPFNSKATIDVLQVPSVNAASYIELNSAIKKLDLLNKEFVFALDKFGFSTPSVLEGGDIEKAPFNINGTLLINSLFENLANRDPLIKAIRNSNLIDINDYANEEAYETAIIENAFEVLLLPLSNDLQNSRSYISIEHVGRDGEKLRNTIFEALEIATQNVKSDFTKKFDQILELEKRKRTELVSNIDQALKLKIFEYNIALEARTAMLSEQAELARVLDIEKNAFEVNSITANSQLLAIETNSNNKELFMRGYKALDTEIEQIKIRKEKLEFVPGTVPLQILKLRIEQDKTLEEIQTIFNTTPLSNDTFRAASYQKFGIKIEKPKIRFIISIIIFMVGWLIVIFTILMRRIAL